MLLPASAMPAGWTPQSTGSNGSTDTGCASLKNIIGKHALARAAASYGAPSGAPLWFERLTAAPQASAANDFDAAVGLVNSCKTLHVAGRDGLAISLHITPASLPKQGLESDSWTLSGTVQSVGVTYVAVIARYGSGVLGEFLWGTETSSLEMSQFVGLVDQASARIMAATGSGSAT
jgi:hypothetical protein